MELNLNSFEELNDKLTMETELFITCNMEFTLVLLFAEDYFKGLYIHM